MSKLEFVAPVVSEVDLIGHPLRGLAPDTALFEAGRYKIN